MKIPIFKKPHCCNLQLKIQTVSIYIIMIMSNVYEMFTICHCFSFRWFRYINEVGVIISLLFKENQVTGKVN